MDTKYIDYRFEDIEKRLDLIELALGDEIRGILIEKGIIKEKTKDNQKDGKTKARAKQEEE